MKLERTVELLALALARSSADGPAWAVDATLGLGGHAEALWRLGPQVRLIGIDRDPQALELAASRLSFAGPRAVLRHAVFDELPEILAELSIPRVSALLLDLGVSSLQLDSVDRGFAYSRDTPLDMRMDQTAARSALDVVNGYTAKELARVFREYGEERFANRIARAIVEAAAPNRSRPPSRWPNWSATPSPHRPAARVDIPPNASSKPCASRSTTSWAFWRA